MDALKVGDLLWMVERLNRSESGQEVSVTKVGRRWAYIATTGDRPSSRGRIDLNDWIIDGGDYTSPGRCFRSQTEYEVRLELAQAWSDLQKLVRDTYRRPDHLSLDDIKAFTARILKAAA